MLPSYPKVFQVGDRNVKDIFNSSFEISEKVDGSLFAFGMIDGRMLYRSKGAEIYPSMVQKLFVPAVEYIESIQDRLPEGVIFYGETLCKPKHNSLEYKRTPKHHIALYAAMYSDGSCMPPSDLSYWANMLDVDRVPILFFGFGGEDHNSLMKWLLERESYLGGPKIEGVVIKNYNQQIDLFGKIYPFTQAKFVSEAFKEIHQKSWTKENTPRGKWDDYKSGFCTEARWRKAVEHLRDAGKLEFSPRDIGQLIKEIQHDITEEEKENIKDKLWQEFGADLLRTSTNGFAQWYKQYLLTGSATIEGPETAAFKEGKQSEAV